MAQWNRKAIGGLGGERRPGQKRLAGGDAVDPVPIQRDRRRGRVAKLDLERVTPLEAELGVAPGERPDRGGRLARAQVERAGPGLQRQHGRSLGGRPGGQRWADQGGSEPGHQLAAIQPGQAPVRSKCASPWPMRTIFRWICPASVVTSDGRRSGHFFAANREAHVISPPPAASRPDMMLSAGVAELVDALDLGSSDESCGGSSPLRPHQALSAFA